MQQTQKHIQLLSFCLQKELRVSNKFMQFTKRSPDLINATMQAPAEMHTAGLAMLSTQVHTIESLISARQMGHVFFTLRHSSMQSL